MGKKTQGKLSRWPESRVTQKEDDESQETFLVPEEPICSRQEHWYCAYDGADIRYVQPNACFGRLRASV